MILMQYGTSYAEVPCPEAWLRERSKAAMCSCLPVRGPCRFDKVCLLPSDSAVPAMPETWPSAAEIAARTGAAVLGHAGHERQRTAKQARKATPLPDTVPPM